jgi:hypothetical protein
MSAIPRKPTSGLLYEYMAFPRSQGRRALAPAGLARAFFAPAGLRRGPDPKAHQRASPLLPEPKLGKRPFHKPL